MKCEFCGANIDIASEKCPFCGMTKSQFTAHREDMRKFAKAYKNVETGVLEKNRRVTERTVRIAIVLFLILINVAMMIMISNSYNIRRAINASAISKNSESHLKALKDLEEDEDYVGLYLYYARNNLRDLNKKEWIEEYRLIFDMSNYYYYAVDYISDIVTYKDLASNEDLESKISSVVNAYDSFLKYYNDYVNERKNAYLYKESCFTDLHLRSYDNMKDNLKCFAIRYLGISEENYETFESESKARKIIMIEDGIKND